MNSNPAIQAAWLQSLLTELLELDGNVDWDQINTTTESNWDSLAQIAIVDEVETRIKHECTPEEVSAMTSYQQVLAILESGIKGAE
jgi:acyl carrier protein